MPRIHWKHNLIIDGKRTCVDCNETKSIAFFNRRDQRINGKSYTSYSSKCTVCSILTRNTHKYHLKYEYCITTSAYHELLAEQNNSCKICKRVFDVATRTEARKNNFLTYPCVDHDHESGQIRGLLCSTCNMGLGGFRDNIYYLKKAIKYIKRSKKLEVI